MHGEGRFLGANRTTYEGSFQLNERHGRGRLQTAAGETYEGEFAHGHFHGRGHLDRADGRFVLCARMAIAYFVLLISNFNWRFQFCIGRLCAWPAARHLHRIIGEW